MRIPASLALAVVIFAGDTAQAQIATRPGLTLDGARRVIAAADPELAVYDVKTLQDRLAATIAAQRFVTWLLTLFAILGLLLIAIGLYGMLAYGVSQRVHEFGVRLALGATSRRVAAAAIGPAAIMVGAGLVLGIAIATALGRVMQRALDFIDRPGVATYVVVTATLVVVAGAATLLPIRRAARIDPMRTLRAD